MFILPVPSGHWSISNLKFMIAPVKMATQATTEVTLSLDSLHSASETSSSETQNSGRPKTSLVWEIFDYDECSDSSICNVKISQGSEVPTQCGKTIKGKNPTNLKQHMRKHHPNDFRKFLEKEEAFKLQKAATNKSTVTQPLLTSMLSQTPYLKESAKQKRITEKLAIFIGSANVATTLVEDQEFREFLHEMDPRYVVPGRTAIRTELSKAVLKLKHNISKELKSAREINLCCDIWSKKGMTESYLGVTAHFFANHKRYKATLAVRHFESPHTGDRILNIVKVVLNDWDICVVRLEKL